MMFHLQVHCGIMCNYFSTVQKASFVLPLDPPLCVPLAQSKDEEEGTDGNEFCQLATYSAMQQHVIVHQCLYVASGNIENYQVVAGLHQHG